MFERANLWLYVASTPHCAVPSSTKNLPERNVFQETPAKCHIWNLNPGSRGLALRTKVLLLLLDPLLHQWLVLTA